MKVLTSIFAIIKTIQVLDAWFQAVSAIYWAWRYNRNRDEFYKARDKADQDDEVEDLQRSIGKHLGLALLIVAGFSGCNTASAVKSLCHLDFVRGVCWVSKSKKEGFSFERMAEMDAACRAKAPGGVCWYSVSGQDLAAIHDKLNRCATGQK